MKLKYNMKKMVVGGEIALVPVDSACRFGGVINVNHTGDFVINCLKEDTTIDKIVAAALEQYNGDEQQIRDYITNFVEKLKENDLLTED